MPYEKFIVIEGSDGVGKGTQTREFYSYATQELKRNVLRLSFPRYGKDSAYYAGRYLDGAYGSANDVPAELGILPFAIDRFAASKEINEYLEKDSKNIVLSDRYMASNLAHQGTKIDDKKERKRFYEQTMHTEYEVLGIPRAAKNIVLLLPVSHAQNNVDKKDPSIRTYTDKKRDVHESSSDHLEKAQRNYQELCEYYPEEFTSIICANKDGSMRTIDEIQKDIRKLLKNI